MSRDKENLKKQLKIKSSCLDDMSEVLVSQKKLINQNDFNRFCDLCGRADNIIEMMRNADYEIAIIESRSDETIQGGELLTDDEIGGLIDELRGKAEKNNELLSELAVTLAESREKVKQELGDTVNMSRIAGYRPGAINSPVYFDKRN